MAKGKRAAELQSKCVETVSEVQSSKIRPRTSTAAQLFTEVTSTVEEPPYFSKYEEPLCDVRLYISWQPFFGHRGYHQRLFTGQSPFTERLSEKQRMAEVTPMGWWADCHGSMDDPWFSLSFWDLVLSPTWISLILGSETIFEKLLLGNYFQIWWYMILYSLIPVYDILIWVNYIIWGPFKICNFCR